MLHRLACVNTKSRQGGQLWKKLQADYIQIAYELFSFIRWNSQRTLLYHDTPRLYLKWV